MEKYTVLIDADGYTVGALYADEAPEVGEVVTVELHDENGDGIDVTGVVIEVLYAECGQ